MSNSFKKYFSAILSIIMIIAGIPTNVYANEINNNIDEEAINNIIAEQGNENSNNIAAEIIENRTENSKTYLMDDGTYCDVISAKQIHESEASNYECIAPQLNQLPDTADAAVELINEYAVEDTADNSLENKCIKSISNDILKYYKCNELIDEADGKAKIKGKAVFLMKSNIRELYFSNNKIINNVTISFDVSSKSNRNSRLYCYYGDNDYINGNISYNDLSSKTMIDLYKIEGNISGDNILKVSFDITDIFSKWDRGSIENNGIYFGNNSGNTFYLSNPTITIDYTPCGYDDINQTYHNIDLGNAGQMLINDCTNTITLKQKLAGIDLNLMGVELTKYLTSSNDGLNSTCGPNSTMNYNSYVKLYNNTLVWKMFDGSEKMFNRPINCIADENGFEKWEEIEDTRTSMYKAILSIDEDIAESGGLFTNYCNMSIEYGNSTYTFDGNGCLSKISCGSSNIKLTFSNGTMSAISDGANNKYSLTYDIFQYNNENYYYLKKVRIKDKNLTPIKIDGQNEYTVDSTYTVNENNTITYNTTYPNGDVLTIVYDSLFNIISVKYNDITTTFEYAEEQKYILGYIQTDVDNQVVSEVTIDSSNTYERTYTYLTEDNKTEILDFNKLGQLVSSIDKGGNQVWFDYDDYDNLRSFALEETTPNIIPNGDMLSDEELEIKGRTDEVGVWDELNDIVSIDDIATIPASLTAEQGLCQEIAGISAEKTYTLSISGKCYDFISSNNAYLKVTLFGLSEELEPEKIVDLQLVKGKDYQGEFETQKIAFKSSKSFTSCEIRITSNMQAKEAMVDYVSLQEAENSTVSIDIESSVNEETIVNGLLKSEIISKGTQKLVTQYTYDDSNNISEITDQNGVKTYYAYENGKMVRKGYAKSDGIIVNPIDFSYSSIGLLESVEQVINTIQPTNNQFKTEYQYKYDQVSQVTKNGITYKFDYYSNGEIKSITLQGQAGNSNVKLLEKDRSDEIYNTIIKYANGHSAKIKQVDDRITEINYTDDNNHTILKYSYTYNNNGKLQSIYDNDKIKTYFFDNGFSVLYKSSSDSSENSETFREIYKKTIAENGEVKEIYFSDIVDENGNATETNITEPIVTSSSQDGNKVYTQNITTKKLHSSYSENINLEYSTNLKSVRDPFGRLAESEVDLNPSVIDLSKENPEYGYYHMNVNSSYSYKELSSDAGEGSSGEENKTVTTKLISQRKDSYEFGFGDNKTTGDIVYAYEYYPNGKLRLIYLVYKEVVDNSNVNDSYISSNDTITRIVYDPICYYEYDANGNISFEFNIQCEVCCKYLYNSYGILSERINYNIDCSIDNLYNLLSVKGIITDDSVETPNPEFDIDQVPDIEKTSVKFDYEGNNIKKISSDFEEGYISIGNDELGQPTYCVSIDATSGTEFIGNCEWTGNLLTAFETQENRFEFTYDVNGYRSSKKSYSRNNNTWKYENTIFYNWEEGILQGIYLILDNEVNSFAAYTDIIYDINNSPVAIQTPSGLQYLFEKDAIGNVIGLINMQGEKICSYKYDAFGRFELDILGDNWGEEIVNAITTIYNPCVYNGALFDYDIGMYFIQDRCYSPYLGRYLNISNYDSLNAVRNEANTNPYIFCGNDPINDLDNVLVSSSDSLIETSQNGFITDMSKAFLSKSYCSSFANSLLKRYGKITSSGKYEFLGMDKERIQSDLFAHSLGRYCEESINRINSVWGDGWLFNNRNSRSIYVNRYDVNYKKYEEIWNSAEAIRKYAVNKGIYIGL